MCFMLLSVPTPQNFLQITIFLGKLNEAFHDKIAGRQSEPKNLAFSLVDVIFIWDREHPLGCEGTETENNHFSSHPNPPWFFQLSSPALLCFLPLFQISADSKVPEKSRMANLFIKIPTKKCLTFCLISNKKKPLTLSLKSLNPLCLIQISCTGQNLKQLCQYTSLIRWQGQSQANPCALIGSFSVGILQCGLFPWKRFQLCIFA